MRGVYAFLDVALVGIFGMTMIDLMVIFTGQEYDLLTIDNAIKSLFTLAGVFYLVFIKMIGEWKMNKINRKIKREELEKLERENDEAEKKHQ